MINGSKYWNNPSYYYIQTNNPTEEMLKKQGVKNFLESCGGTSAVCCGAAVGAVLEIKCPGAYRPQPEEVLTDWFNDPVNYGALEKVRDDIGPKDLPGNRVPQYYPLAMKSVFNIFCKFIWVDSHFILAEYFKLGYAIQLCLKSPSHYVAGVGYDTASSEIVINDPWPNRFKDGKGGFNRKIPSSFNLEPFAIIYPPIGEKI